MKRCSKAQILHWPHPLWASINTRVERGNQAATRTNTKQQSQWTVKQTDEFTSACKIRATRAIEAANHCESVEMASF